MCIWPSTWTTSPSPKVTSRLLPHMIFSVTLPSCRITSAYASIYDYLARSGIPASRTIPPTRTKFAMEVIGPYYGGVQIVPDACFGKCLRMSMPPYTIRECSDDKTGKSMLLPIVSPVPGPPLGGEVFVLREKIAAEDGMIKVGQIDVIFEVVAVDYIAEIEDTESGVFKFCRNAQIMRAILRLRAVYSVIYYRRSEPL